MEYVAAIRSTDSRVRLVQTKLVEINLLHVQNKTNTVRVKAETSERRAKFDPDEAMCQLNKIGHDFSRVHVGKNKFTYKCRLCFLRGERSFLKQLLKNSVLPLCTAFFPCLPPSPLPHLTSLNPSSLVHPHLKTILLVGADNLTQIIKPCQIKNHSSAQ